MSKFSNLRSKEEGMKLETEELIGKVLTATSCKSKSTKNGETSVWRFKEIPEGFYFGGTILTKLCKQIEEDKELQEELKNGVIKFKLVMKKGENNGREYVDYEVVEVGE